MKVEKTLSSVVLVDTDMRIISEVLDFTNTLSLQGKSINTIENYVRDLKVFYEWLEREGLKFYEVKPSFIPNFIEYIDMKSNKGRVSPATLNRYLATLSSFYRHFEVVGGFVEESPLIKVKGYTSSNNRGYLRHVTKNWDDAFYSYFKRKQRKKSDRKRLYPNTVQKYYQTIENVWAEDESLVFRNKLIFRVLYETGMRVSELLHLRINDFDYPDPTEKTGNIYLIERNEKDGQRQLKSGERTIPVSASLLQKMDEYVLYHRPHSEEVEYVFVSHSRANLGEALSRTSVEDMLHKVRKESGIDYFRLTPHSLRHTHASELQDIGVDVNIIKERLGHKSIETTSKYAKPSVETLAKAHERYLESKKGVMPDE